MQEAKCRNPLLDVQGKVRLRREWWLLGFEEEAKRWEGCERGKWGSGSWIGSVCLMLKWKDLPELHRQVQIKVCWRKTGKPLEEEMC